MNKHFFEAARIESLNSNYKGYASVKIGCVVYYKGTILSKGFNSNKTHTIQKKYNLYRYDDRKSNHYYREYVHAEIMALSKIKFLDIDFSKIELYLYRQTKDGKLAMSRPCNSCMAYIKKMGIRKIHYTTYDGYATEILNKEVKK